MKDFTSNILIDIFFESDGGREFAEKVNSQAKVINTVFETVDGKDNIKYFSHF